MRLLSLIRRRAGAAVAVFLSMALSMHLGILIGLRWHIEREGERPPKAALPAQAPPAQAQAHPPPRDGGPPQAQAQPALRQPLAPVRLEAVGELGITRGALPYPTDVLAGAARPAEGAPPLAQEGPDLPDGGSAAQELLGAMGEPLTGQVTGQVVDERGLPIAGARVEAQVGRARRLALSDRSGRFSLRGLPAGAVAVVVQHRGYAPLRSSAAEAGPLLLQLQPGGGIEGRVRDRRLGGVPERLQLTLTTGSGRQAVPVGRDGGFRLTGLPPGAATLRAQAPGFEALSQEIQIPAGDSPESVTLRDLLLELNERESEGGSTP